MNVLLLTPQRPYPARQGTTLRNHNILCHLARNHQVDLLTFLAPGEEWTEENPLAALCRRVEWVAQPVRSLRERAWTTLTVPLPDMALRLHTLEMGNKLGAMLATGGYDLVQIEGIEMAAYGLAAGKATGCAVVFDDHNCEYLLQYRNAMADLRRPRRLAAGLYSIVQWRKLVAYERSVMQQSSATVAVSGVDRDALAKIAPGVELRVIPNGADVAALPDLSTSVPAGVNLLFTGKMDYRPNVDAAIWFAEEVLPHIRTYEPEARFQIVGMNPHPRLDALRGRAGIEITGFVEDVRPYLEGCAVYVLPLRVGGGTRFKALEALGCGLPVVSTTLGVEGLGVRDGEELLLADTPRAFADAVLRLIVERKKGSETVRGLGARARRFVETHYSWERILPAFDELYAALGARNASSLKTERQTYVK